MFISKMNNNSSEGKMSFVEFHSVKVKGNWTHLAEKNSRPGDKIATAFSIMKIFNRIIIRNILNYLFYFEHQNHVILSYFMLFMLNHVIVYAMFCYFVASF